jgi:hypothetical protein
MEFVTASNNGTGIAGCSFKCIYVELEGEKPYLLILNIPYKVCMNSISLGRKQQLKLTFTTMLIIFFMLGMSVSVLSLNVASSVISSSGIVKYGDYTVLQEGTMFKAINSGTGATFSSDQASVAINCAINALSSGTVYVQPGTYPIGRDTVIAEDTAWVSVASSVSINNTVPGIEGIATQINIPYPAPTGLVACYNFLNPINLSGNWSLGFWFKPSTDLSNKAATGDYGGSPLKFLLSTSANCSSPVYSAEIWHSEWATATWKNYKIPNTPPSGRSLPESLANIRSIGIEVWSNPNCITPATPYNIIIDDVHAHSGEIRVHSNIRLIGAGAGNTILRLNPHTNIPMMVLEGSNVEIDGLQLDGNYDNQDTIDECQGIYDPGNAGISIHHNYIHHTKGAGIKLRSNNTEVYENLIEWTENPNIDLGCSPSFIHVYNNTLKYAIDDDNIRISGEAHNITIEHNLLYGVTSSLLASGDPSVPVVWRNRQPLEWNGIRLDRNAYNNLVQYNKIFNAPGYGIAVCYAHDNTVQYSEIYYSVRDQLSVQSWGGPEYNAHIIGNLIVGGAQRGINTGGSNDEIRDNWSRNNAGGGIFIVGSGEYGSGNYAEEGNNGAPAGFMSSTPPNIPTFQAGTTW